MDKKRQLVPEELNLRNVDSDNKTNTLMQICLVITWSFRDALNNKCSRNLNKILEKCLKKNSYFDKVAGSLSTAL